MLGRVLVISDDLPAHRGQRRAFVHELVGGSLSRQDSCARAPCPNGGPVAQPVPGRRVPLGGMVRPGLHDAGPKSNLRGPT